MPKSTDKADAKSATTSKSAEATRKPKSASRRDGLAKVAKELAKQVI